MMDDKDEHAAILAFASDRLPHHDTMRIWFEPRDHINGPAQWKEAAKTRQENKKKHMITFGPLNFLPTELVTKIVLSSDISTTWRLMSTNTSFRDLILALPEFRLIYTYAANLLCALLRTGLSSAYSLQDLHASICLSNCVECNSFGLYIFLPTLDRACSDCLLYSPRFRMNDIFILRNHVSKHNYLFPPPSQLRTFRLLPGHYMHTNISPSVNSRIEIASVKALSSLYVDPALTHDLNEVYERNSQIWLRSRDDRPEPPEYASMAACATPVVSDLTMQTGEVERGVYCIGCRDKYLYNLRHRVRNGNVGRAKGAVAFSKKGYLHHFYEECDWSRRKWEEHRAQLTESKI